MAAHIRISYPFLREDGAIIFALNEKGTPHLELRANGEAYVKGKLVAVESGVYQAFRTWMAVALSDVTESETATALHEALAHYAMSAMRTEGSLACAQERCTELMLEVRELRRQLAG